MITLKQHQVPETVLNIRLVNYVVKIFSEIPSRSAAKKAIKRGEILVDDLKPDQGEWIKPGQLISLVDLQKKPPKIFKLKIEVIYEDEHIAVVRKPAGISVSGNKYKTILNTLAFNLMASTSEDALKWPLPVHRLDYPTSGLLLIAKTKFALTNLGNQFEKRLVKKTYHAIVIGKIHQKGIIDQTIDGQEAITAYQLIDIAPSLKVGHISLVRLKPLTGRTHQLRIHLSEIGHPIIGDNKYGTKLPLLKGKGLFLSATTLEFSHPVSNNKCSFEINQPQKFSSFLKRETRRWKKYNT